MVKTHSVVVLLLGCVVGYAPAVTANTLSHPSDAAPSATAIAPSSSAPSSSAPDDGHAAFQVPTFARDVVGYGRCLSADDVAAAEDGKERRAFGPGTIALGPLYWASADRTFQQVMLAYWRILDVEEGTRLTLIAPGAVDYCSPESRRLIGPLGLAAIKTDADGIAGYIGPYFFRRDKDAVTDVLAPVYFRFRTETDAGLNDTIVLGPYVSVERPHYSVKTLPGLFLAANTPAGAFLGGPGVAHVTAERGHAWAVGPYVSASGARGAMTSLAPLYLGMSGGNGARIALVPGLYASAKTPTLDLNALGPAYALRYRGAQHAGVFGLFAAGDSRPRSYAIAPLAGALAIRTEDAAYGMIGPAFRLRTPDFGVSGIAPLYVEGILGPNADDPLIFGTGPGFFWAKDNDGVVAVAGLTRVDIEPERTTIHSPGLGYYDDDRARGEKWWIAPLALTYGSFSAEQQRLIAGPITYFSDAKRRRATLFPLLSVKQARAGGHVIVPPLLAGAYRERDSLTLHFGSAYGYTSRSGREGGVLGLFHRVNVTDSGAYQGPSRVAAERLGAELTEATLIPPLAFAHIESATSSLLAVGPYVDAVGAEESFKALLPAYFDYRAKDPDGLRVFGVPAALWLDVADGPSAFTLRGPAAFWDTPSLQLLHVAGALHAQQARGTGIAFAPGLGAFASFDVRDGGYVLAPGLYAARSRRRTPAGLVRTTLAAAPGALYVRADTPGQPSRHSFAAGPAFSVELPDAAYTGVAPVFAHAQTEQGQALAVPALTLFAFSERGRRATFFTGLYRVRDEGGADSGVFPLFGGGYGKDGYSPLLQALSERALPQWLRPRGPDSFSYAYAPAMLWKKDADSEFVVAGPVASRRDASGDETLAAFPVGATWRKRGTKSFRAVAPLALTSVGRDDDGAHLYAGPLLLDRAHDAQRVALAPLFYHARDKSGYVTAAPFFHEEQDADSFSRTIGPVRHVHYTSGAWWTLSPVVIAGAFDGFEGFIAPFVLRARGEDWLDIEAAATYVNARFGDDRYLAVAPLVASHSSPQGHTIVAPGAYAHREAGGNVSAFVATGYFLDDGQHRSFGLAPFYFGQRDQQGRTDVLPLLLASAWSTRNPDGTRAEGRVFGPLYSYKSNVRGANNHEQGLLPLLAYGEGQDLWALSAAASAIGMVYGDDAAFALTSGRIGYWSVPGVLAATRRDASASTLLVGPYARTRSARGARDSLFPLFHAANLTTERTLAAPLLITRHHRDRVRGGSFTLAAPLLTYARQGTQGDYEVMSGPFYAARQGQGVTRGALGIAHLFDDGDDRLHLLPLYAQIRNEVADVDAFGPGFRVSTPEARVEGIFGLYAHAASAGSDIEVFAPGLGRVHAGTTTHNVIAPLMTYWREDAQSRLLVAPGVWHRRHSGGHETVAGPFYIDVQQPDWGITTVPGAYAHAKVFGRELTLAPFYARYENAESVTSFYGPIGVERARESTAYSYFAGPFWSYGQLHDDHVRWRVLMGALGYEREGTQEEWMFLYNRFQSSSTGAPSSSDAS